MSSSLSYIQDITHTFLISVTIDDLYRDLILQDSMGGVSLVLAGSDEGGGNAVTGGRREAGRLKGEGLAEDLRTGAALQRTRLSVHDQRFLY